MKARIYKKHDYKVVRAALKQFDIRETALGQGKENVVIHTDDGNYSAFMAVWKKQNLSYEDLTEGDLLEIKYYEKDWRGKPYRNFIKVEVVRKALRAADVVNKNVKPSSITKEEVEELLKDMPPPPQPKAEKRETMPSDKELEELLEDEGAKENG